MTARVTTLGTASFDSLVDFTLSQPQALYAHGPRFSLPDSHLDLDVSDLL